MADVTARALGRSTMAVLARVEAGESITITVHGRPVATLRPFGLRPRSMSRDDFIRRVLPVQADPGLRRELREMLPDTTGDLPWRD